MAKLFFDVFPTLDVSGDMKKILSEMEVTKVGMNHERDHIRVYLLGSHLTVSYTHLTLPTNSLV